jgi:hypothetical protein
VTGVSPAYDYQAVDFETPRGRTTHEDGEHNSAKEAGKIRIVFEPGFVD